MMRDPAKDADGNVIAYTKPVMMIIDEFSTSTADSVPSMFQEAGRGLLYGYRSNGAGGNNTSVTVGPYSEGTVGVTMGVQVKHTPVSVTGYPTTGIIENVGVHPDIENDYMTKDNLLQGGAPFVNQFLAEMAKFIRSKQ
jgi:C-terminal processing protease CtpA/Prc